MSHPGECDWSTVFTSKQNLCALGEASVYACAFWARVCFHNIVNICVHLCRCILGRCLRCRDKSISEIGMWKWFGIHTQGFQRLAVSVFQGDDYGLLVWDCTALLTDSQMSQRLLHEIHWLYKEGMLSFGWQGGTDSFVNVWEIKGCATVCLYFFVCVWLGRKQWLKKSW